MYICLFDCLFICLLVGLWVCGFVSFHHEGVELCPQFLVGEINTPPQKIEYNKKKSQQIYRIKMGKWVFGCLFHTSYPPMFTKQYIYNLELES